MNPSSDGWIKKLLKDVSKNETYLEMQISNFYKKLKLSGYIYGNNVDVLNHIFDKEDWTEEELCKINHVLSLLYIYRNNPKEESFVEHVIRFYKSVDNYKESFIGGILGKKQSFLMLESIIHKRIHIDDGLIKNNFNRSITNAYLFVDILAYQKFLETETISDRFFKTREMTMQTIALKVFELKSIKTIYDENLVKLFTSSLRYNPEEIKNYDEVIAYPKSQLEKNYCIDIACMASWSDQEIESTEAKFLYLLGKDLNFDTSYIDSCINEINTFYTTHKEQIFIFSNKNLTMSFYDHSSKMVTKLIKRNSKRLVKELRESKELVYLLAQSTNRNLTAKEKRKVQEQTMDLIKTIPSLTIFMLPGGAILLPLFIKFIPKLLPSAFDENRVEE